MAIFNPAGSILTSLIFAGAASAALAGAPMGRLEIHGTVQVRTAGSSAPVPVNTATYPWYSGDTVTTQASSAVLILDGGGSLGIGRESSVRVSRRARELTVNLNQGTLLYAFPEPPAGLTIQAGSYTLAPAAPPGRVLDVSAGGGALSGVVTMLDGGRLRALARQGRIEITSATGAAYELAAGESVRLSIGSGNPAPLQSRSVAAAAAAAAAAGDAWAGLRFVGGGIAIMLLNNGNADARGNDPPATQ